MVVCTITFRGAGIGDLYSKLNDYTLFRQEWAERVGLGSVVPNCHFSATTVTFSRQPTLREEAEWLPPVILALIGIHRRGLLILPARFERSN